MKFDILNSGGIVLMIMVPITTVVLIGTALGVCNYANTEIGIQEYTIINSINQRYENNHIVEEFMDDDKITWLEYEQLRNIFEELDRNIIKSSLVHKKETR